MRNIVMKASAGRARPSRALRAHELTRITISLVLVII